MQKILFKSLSNTWLPRIVAAGLIISYGLALYSIIGSGILPDRYVLTGTILSLIVVAALLYGLLKPTLRRRIRIPTIIISLLVIGISLYAYSVSSATTKFLSTIQPDDFTAIEYNLIAKKDRSIELNTPNLQTGLLSSDTNNDLVKSKVSELADTTYHEYENPTKLILALEDNSRDTAALQSSNYSLLSEVNPELSERYEILATFTVRVPKGETPSDSAVTEPFIVYISGIDTYGEIASVSRSDVNILAVVNPKTHQILLVNTPRDYYVELAGTGGAKDKLTHAGIYGVDTSRRTLEKLYDTDIDYYLRVNFSSLTKLVDTLGGITVNSEYAFTAENYSFQKGANQLNGAQALAFARERKSFQAGDRTRGENQQRVITAIIQKLSNPRVVGNYRSVLSALQDASQTNMSQASLSSLIKTQLDDMARWQTTSISVDGTDNQATTYSVGNQLLYVMQPNQSSVRDAQAAIKQQLQ